MSIDENMHKLKYSGIVQEHMCVNWTFHLII